MNIDKAEIIHMGTKYNEYSADLDLEKKFKSDFQELIQELKNKEKTYRLGNEAYRSKLEVLYKYSSITNNNRHKDNLSILSIYDEMREQLNSIEKEKEKESKRVLFLQTNINNIHNQLTKEKSLLHDNRIKLQHLRLDYQALTKEKEHYKKEAAACYHQAEQLNAKIQMMIQTNKHLLCQINRTIQTGKNI